MKRVIGAGNPAGLSYDYVWFWRICTVQRNDTRLFRHHRQTGKIIVEERKICRDWGVERGVYWQKYPRSGAKYMLPRSKGLGGRVAK
jgi:hypothetical protein